VFQGWQDGMTHIGTYGAPNGGFFGEYRRGLARLDAEGRRQGGRMFKGADCTLCAAPSWHVTKKKID
jgi:hypothetical protein